jgi:hypothetical protein
MRMLAALFLALPQRISGTQEKFDNLNTKLA